MHTHRVQFLVMILGLAVGLAGCATFHAQPIAPAQTAAAFQARRLDDSGLRKFLGANLHREFTAWPPREWTLETLTFAAFYSHPDLEVARAHVDVAQAGIRTAGARPNPTIQLTPGYNIDAPSATPPWLMGLTFDVPIETAGKRGYRIAHARQLTEAARLELAETAWRVRSRLRVALAEHLLARRELDLLRAEEKLRSEVFPLTERRYAVARVSLNELNEARAELSRTRLSLRAAEGRITETKIALAAALGLPVSAVEGISLVWPEMDSPPAEEGVSPEAIQCAGLLNRLDIRRSLAEYAAAEALLQLEIAKQYPDLQLGPGYDFDAGDNKFSLGISLTLPILNQNQGPIAQAKARRKEEAARFLALQAKIIHELEHALAQYRAALGELQEANRAVVEFRKVQIQMEERFASGGIDPLVFSQLLLRRVEATRARLEALSKTQRALGALEDTLQRPLEGTLAVPNLESVTR